MYLLLRLRISVSYFLCLLSSPHPVRIPFPQLWLKCLYLFLSLELGASNSSAVIGHLCHCGKAVRSLLSWLWASVVRVLGNVAAHTCHMQSICHMAQARMSPPQPFLASVTVFSPPVVARRERHEDNPNLERYQNRARLIDRMHSL